MNKRTATGGRPSKGQRKALMSRVAIPIGEKIEEQAAAAGYQYVGDYIASILAREAGMPELAPVQTDSTRLELPIPAA